MKIFVLLCLCLTFSSINVYANEITEDYLDIASNYCTFGQYSDAMTYLDKIIQIEPLNKEIRELKNTLLRVTNTNTKSYLTTKNKNIREAQNYKMQGEREKEIATLNSISTDFWAIYYLAEYYRNIDDFKNAIFYYEKAALLQPDYSQSYLGMAEAYLSEKDYTNAIKYLNKYLTYNKDSDIAYAMRARAYMNTNNISQAVNDIKKAIQIDENISYLLIEAKILYFKGDYSNSLEKLNLLSKNIQTSEVYKYMGLCDYALNNYTSALLNIDKAIILSDDDRELNAKYNEIKSALEKQ